MGIVIVLIANRSTHLVFGRIKFGKMYKKLHLFLDSNCCNYTVKLVLYVNAMGNTIGISDNVL